MYCLSLPGKKENGLLRVGKEYVHRVGDSPRRTVDHPTLPRQKENGLPKAGVKNLHRIGDSQRGTVYPQTRVPKVGEKHLHRIGDSQKGDGVPPDSFWTKRKRSDETAGGTSSTQRLGKPDTKSWHKKKHNNKYAT